MLTRRATISNDAALSNELWAFQKDGGRTPFQRPPATVDLHGRPLPYRIPSWGSAARNLYSNVAAAAMGAPLMEISTLPLGGYCEDGMSREETIGKAPLKSKDRRRKRRKDKGGIYAPLRLQRLGTLTSSSSSESSIGTLDGSFRPNPSNSDDKGDPDGGGAAAGPMGEPQGSADTATGASKDTRNTRSTRNRGLFLQMFSLMLFLYNI